MICSTIQLSIDYEKTISMEDYEGIKDQIKAFAESQNELAKRAVPQYQTIVGHLITNNCTDSNQIQYTLDFTLDFCFDEEMLTLYRKLCRHLYSFDQSAAIYYVEAYSERWDEEDN